MAEELEKSPIQNKYAEQYASDLVSNRKEQGEVSAQIAGLQQRLEQLKAEEGWLSQAQGSLPAAPVPTVPEAQTAAEVAEASPAAAAEQADTSAPAEAPADPTRTLPQQRQDQSAQEEPKRPTKKKVTAKKAAAKKTTARTTAKRTTAKPAKKASAKKPAAEEVPAQPAAATEASADEEKAGPPLWQLILDLLLKTPGQPCVARELHDQLAQEHPGRATSVQTVRNNLETLVKKGLAEKSRQQGNAMYTANAAASAAPEADGTVGGEAEQADETAAEKVPAEV